VPQARGSFPQLDPLEPLARAFAADRRELTTTWDRRQLAEDTYPRVPPPALGTSGASA